MQAVIFYLGLFCIGYLYGSVDHKNDFIDSYLSQISSNMKEKTEITEHIKKNPNGTYIDIGTGGDAIAHIIDQISKKNRTHLIAADVEPLVVESIKTRQSEIKKYINSKTGPQVSLEVMSATEMTPIKDNTISGISASALTHEVFSYTPFKEPLAQFIEEVCRVLEKDGVFVYRDPTWVDDPKSECTLVIKNETAKYFTCLFLPKFLDRKFSQLQDYKNECYKPNLYQFDQIKLNVYLKSKNRPSRFTFEDFFNTPSSLIDYSKNFSIEAPKGLIAEIQRHYIVFLKEQEVTRRLDADILSKSLTPKSLRNKEKKTTPTFTDQIDLYNTDNVTAQKLFPKFFDEKKRLKDIFNRGIIVELDNKKELVSALNELHLNEVNRNLIYLIDQKTLFIDPKILPLLFQGEDKGIFPFLPKNVDLPKATLVFLRLEGEEHYFYKTTDQLITYFGQLSQFTLKNNHKKDYILSPIDIQYIKEVSRSDYKEILEKDMTILDKYGNSQAPITDKSIIHFKLQQKDKALAVYEKLIYAHPKKYTSLKKWIDTWKKKKS